MEHLLNEQKPDEHTIVIFEDLSYALDEKPKAFNNAFKDFIVNSRHHAISTIYIMHTIQNAMNKTSSIDRFYLQNISIIVIFRLYDTKRSVYQYLQRYFAHNKNFVKILDEMFNILSKHTNYPYLFIQPRKHNLPDDFCKIRSCLFDKDKNFIFVSGYNSD